MIIKKRTSWFNFQTMKPDFNYCKCLWYKLIRKMVFIGQYIIFNGKNFAKKETNGSIPS